MIVLRMLRSFSLEQRKFALLGFALTIAVAFSLLPRIGQNPNFHLFADDRTIWGIPNFFDVVSNLPFLFTSLYGLLRFREARGIGGISYLVFLIGIGATCFGSMYYHLEPTNERLFWDRLPMTLGFVGFVSLLLSLRVSESWAKISLIPLLALGLASVQYWLLTERLGIGDLRPYLFVQFGLILFALMILALFPGRAPTTKALSWLILSYFLAKVAEAQDRNLFSWFGETLSGHTLKHLAAGIGCFAFVWLTSRREENL